MLKREWGAESNGKLPHLSMSSKTAAWVPEFAVKDLPLSRTAILMVVVVVVDLGFTTLLTPQVISVAFYSEHEKSDKF